MSDDPFDFPPVPEHNHTTMRHCPGCVELAHRAAQIMPSLLSSADLFDENPSRFWAETMRANVSDATAMIWWGSAVTAVTIPGWDRFAYTFMDKQWTSRIPDGDEQAHRMWHETIAPALRMIFLLAEKGKQESALAVMSQLVDDCKNADRMSMVVLSCLALVGTASERLATLEYSYQKLAYLVCMGTVPEWFFGESEQEVVGIAMVSGALAANDQQTALAVAQQMITPGNLGTVLTTTARVISRCLDPDHPEAMVMNTQDGSPMGVIDPRYVVDPLDELDRPDAVSVIGLKFVWELMTSPEDASAKLIGWCREDIEVYEGVAVALLSWFAQYLVRVESEMAEEGP